MTQLEIERKLVEQFGFIEKRRWVGRGQLAQLSGRTFPT